MNQDFLEAHALILMEAAVVERIRRAHPMRLHPTLANAPLVLDPDGIEVLTGMYQEYMAIAEAASVPFLMCTPTWRANRERVKAERLPQTINADAVQFMHHLRRSRESGAQPVRIGGMIGCRHDCYRPEEGLCADDAAAFHAWQIDELAGAGVDFLIAETLPNVEEAIGIARAMNHAAVPGLISFVISRDGRVLDGTPLMDAIDRLDEAVDRPPLGYLVNCAYPTFLCADQQPARLFHRLIGFQANASSLDHSELDGAEILQVESVAEWGDAMGELNRSRGVRILGGCCGTGPEHLRYLAERK